MHTTWKPLFPALLVCLAGAAEAQSLIGPVRVNPTGGNTTGCNRTDGLNLVSEGDFFFACWTEQFNTAEQTQDIYGATSTDGGYTWTLPVRIDLGDAPNQYDSEHPRAVICDDGTIVVVWEDRRDDMANGGTGNEDLFYNRSTDGGQTWMATSPALSANAGSDLLSDVDYDTSGLAVTGNTVHCVWEENFLTGVSGPEEMWYSRSDDSGATWTPPVILNGGAPNYSDVDDPKIAASGNNVVISFVDDENGGDQQAAFNSTDGGQNWTKQWIESSPNADVDGPTLHNEGDTFVILFEDADSKVSTLDSLHAIISLDGGRTWGGEVVISENVENTANSQALWQWAAIEPTGGPDIFVVYSDDSINVAGGGPGGQAGAECYIAYSYDGGANWVKDVALDGSDPRRSHRPEVAVDGSDVVVCFEHNTDGSNIAAYTYSSDQGANWTVPIDAQTLYDVDAENPGEGPRLTFDADNDKAVNLYWWNAPTGCNEVYVSGLDFDTEVGTAYCFGKTSDGNPCPCGNDNDGTLPRGGCQHDDSFAGARLDASGEASVSGDTLVLEGSRGPISNSTLFFQANNNLDGQSAFLGDGIRCAGGGLIRIQPRATDANGDAGTTIGISVKTGVSAGETKYYQWWLRDPGGSPCGDESNTSNGYEITWIP